MIKASKFISINIFMALGVCCGWLITGRGTLGFLMPTMIITVTIWVVYVCLKLNK